MKRELVLPALLLSSLIFSSCHRKPVQPAAPPAASKLALLSYEAAEDNFEKGDYAAAARSYEAYLLGDAPDHADRACFRLGLSYGLAPDKAQNLRLARAHLERLVSQFPESPYRTAADLILLLLGEIEKLSGRVYEQQSRIRTLTEEMQLLKAIDMKRSPSRPPP